MGLGVNGVDGLGVEQRCCWAIYSLSSLGNNFEIIGMYSNTHRNLWEATFHSWTSYHNLGGLAQYMHMCMYCLYRVGVEHWRCCWCLVYLALVTILRSLECTQPHTGIYGRPLKNPIRRQAITTFATFIWKVNNLAIKVKMEVDSHRFVHMFVDSACHVWLFLAIYIEHN